LDKVDGNGKLSWLAELLRSDTWVKHPYCKVAVAYDIIDQLEYAGLWWQAARARNLLHRWMKSISCKDPRGSLTLRGEEEALYA
jgi:hypothetical protein